MTKTSKKSLVIYLIAIIVIIIIAIYIIINYPNIKSSADRANPAQPTKCYYWKGDLITCHNTPKP